MLSAGTGSDYFLCLKCQNHRRHLMKTFSFFEYSLLMLVKLFKDSGLFFLVCRILKPVDFSLRATFVCREHFNSL